MNAANEDLYALQWNNHTKLLKGIFNTFRNDNELVDVTLSCEGKKLKAHKIVLSACSLYFLELFRDNPCQHPIIILRDIKYQALLDILSFMYVGEVNVAMDNLNMFLQTAEYLQVKGLSEELPNIESHDKEGKEKQKALIKNIEKITKEKKSNDLEKRMPGKKDSNENVHTTEHVTKEESPQKDSFNNSNLPTQIRNSRVSPESMEHSTEQIENLKKEYIEIEDYNEDDSVEYIEIDQNELPNNDYNDQYLISDLEGSSSTSVQNKSYPCPRCNKVFNHQISLKLHLPRHSGRTSCHLCHAVLGRKYDLKVHLKRKHNIEMSVSRKRSSDNTLAELWLAHKYNSN